MKTLKLAWRNILGEGFRSLAVFFCAGLVAGLALVATFVVKGAEASLHGNLQKMGADILVLPWGTITDKVNGVRMMSAAIHGWIPYAYLEKLEAIEGVERVSAQLHLESLDNSPYLPGQEMFLVAFNPATDFALKPWASQGMLEALAVGQAVTGAAVMLPAGQETLLLFGQVLDPAVHLTATGTSIDQTVFVTFETAEIMAAGAAQLANGSVEGLSNTLSAVLIQVHRESDPHQVALKILENIPGVVPLEMPDMFQIERRQMVGVLRTLFSVLSGVWVITVLFMGMVFTIAAHERRREIGVLRALGFPRHTIVRLLMTEGALLAVLGGFLGAALALGGLESFGRHWVNVVGLPLYTPSLDSLLIYFAAGQTLALLSVALAALIPTWKISREEVVEAMRA